MVGSELGTNVDGASVGTNDGAPVGVEVGPIVGVADGNDGMLEGLRLGAELFNRLVDFAIIGAKDGALLVEVIKYNELVE